MARINLLPWRDEERKERKRQFFSLMVLSAILSGAVMFVVNLSIQQQVATQNGRNSYLETEIKVLEEQIKQIETLERARADLEQRMKIIQDLQQSRPLMVHLFDELPRLLPDGLYLTELTRKDVTLSIKGKTESNPRVASFMRQIENSPWVGNAVFGNIVSNRNSNVPSSDFTMTATQKGVTPPQAGGAK
jgi:type IV pilus assembly protein PilN